jgi:asparagine synthase (glutamine-hydrolysing)
MCGIAGFVLQNVSDTERHELLFGMTHALAHRGPDDSGLWSDAALGVSLGQRRLSILDLSPLGHQPMGSASGDLIVVFNGEVYNYRELRAELECRGVRFRGDSDTEVVVAAIDEWGINAALRRFNGMFALAVWDRAARLLSLARDRVGIKPLYYGWRQGAFVFASELKAFDATPRFAGQIDVDALALFLRHNYIPTPFAAYLETRKLEPGTLLTLDLKEIPVSPAQLSLAPFWSARDAWQQGARSPLRLPRPAAKERLRDLISSAVELQMAADVPLGAFLSGGIDSALVTALMQRRSGRKLHTFSIGFDDPSLDESGHARAVARHLGTEHVDWIMTGQDLLQFVSQAVDVWDEPFSDSSQLATLALSQLARQSVTVALSGDGGDELFAGYNHYARTARLWRWHQRLPKAVRSMSRVGASVLRDGGRLATWTGARGEHLQEIFELAGAERLSTFYRRLISHQRTPCSLILAAHEPPTQLTRRQDEHRLGDADRRMTFWDFVSYLPDDILTKVDRASMAVGLEVRVPLLDHRIVEFAVALPTSAKVQGQTRKTLLREVLYDYVPRALVDRPKQGFGVPLDRWLRTELREWAGDLLSESTLRAHGVLNVPRVQAMWQGFLGKQGPWQAPHLWDIIVLQAWLDRRGRNRSAASVHAGAAIRHAFNPLASAGNVQLA